MMRGVFGWDGVWVGSGTEAWGRRVVLGLGSAGGAGVTGVGMLSYGASKAPIGWVGTGATVGTDVDSPPCSPLIIN